MLTKKQKEEKHLAEIRKQALLASGVQIEGLQQASGNGTPAVKKVVYGNRKKKGPIAKDVSPAPESRPRSPVVEKPIEAIPDDDAKSDWEASSDEDHDDAKAQGEAVKDSWDASSNDEEEKPPRKFKHFDLESSFLISDPQKLLNTWQRTSPLQKFHQLQKQGQSQRHHLRNRHPVGRHLSNLFRKRNHLNPRKQTMMTTIQALMITSPLMIHLKKH